MLITYQFNRQKAASIFLIYSNWVVHKTHLCSFQLVCVCVTIFELYVTIEIFYVHTYILTPVSTTLPLANSIPIFVLDNIWISGPPFWLLISLSSFHIKGKCDIFLAPYPLLVLQLTYDIKIGQLSYGNYSPLSIFLQISFF